MDTRIEGALHEARAERDLDFDARIQVYEASIIIDTHISRDPSRSNNGGEYYFWERIWPNENGDALMRRFASCDFWQPEEEPELIGLTFDEACKLVAKLAQDFNIPVGAA